MQMLRFKGVYIFLFVLSTFFTKLTYSQSGVAICLNEYMVTNTQGAPATLDNYFKPSDWVELYNNFTATVNLQGYYMSNDRSNLKKWTFPNPFIMQPGQYSIIWMSGRNEDKIVNGLHHTHTNFTIDQCKNQWIILTAPNGVIRDSIFVQRTQENHTRGRLNSPVSDYVTVGVAGWRVYTSPTFSTVNNLTPWIDYCPMPLFTEPAGIATISSPTFEIYTTFPGAAIDTACFNVWYTMDGSFPYPSTANPWGQVNSCALQYIDPATPLIAPPTILTMFRAVCYPKTNYTVTPAIPPTYCELNYLPSFCETNTYFCESGVLEPDFSNKFGVLSLAIDNGPVCPPTPTLWFGVGTPATTVHVEYFDLKSSGKNRFVTEGYGSMSKPINESWLNFQKGFNLSIDDRRGFGCNFESQVFNVPELGVSTRTIFSSLNVYGGDFESHSIPNSSNPSCGTGLRDVFIQSLAAKNNLKVNPLHYKPIAVFVDGRYWGTFNFKEVFDVDYEAFYNKQTATDKTTMLFYHNGEGAVQTHTSTNNWKSTPGVDLYSFAATYPFNTTSATQVSANYNTLKKRMDIPNFMDWNILNSYCQNAEIYNYNIAMAKGSNTLTSGGRWHQYLWNMPSTFQYTCSSQNGYYNTPITSPCAISQSSYALSPLAYNGQGIIFYNLMNKNGGNAEFRRDYLTRYQDLLNGPLSCTEMINHWNTINNLYRLEMKKHEDPATTPNPGLYVTQTDLWDTNMNNLKYAIQDRCKFMATAFNTVSCYGLVGPYPIEVDVRPANSGMVKLNTQILPYYAWSGKYFIGPMSFKAYPADTTFVFDHWEIEKHVETNNRPLSLDSIGIYFGNSSQGDKVVAVFTDRKEEAALPSGFSPNGDGKNDVFGILGSGKYSREYELRIWNRWGQEVFRTTDPTVGWDGNFNGAQAQTGVYAYYITFKNVYNEPKEYKGNVTLVR
jgi:gliding motility-associated-like protein